MRVFDQDEAAKLNAEPWQTDLLQLNPEYVHWGPNEDYMWKKGSGWDSAQSFESWQEFGPWGLDEFNECVNFYFSVERDSKECPTCGGNGYHAEAQQTARTFYQHSCLPGEVAWNDKITDDEAEMIAECRSYYKGKGTGEINQMQREGGLNSFDAIDRFRLIKKRLERLGLVQWCDECAGDGYVFTAPKAHVCLTLWWLHPRKGCSRGVEIKNIVQTDLSAITSFLMLAAQRNADRFARLSSPETPHA